MTGATHGGRTASLFNPPPEQPRKDAMSRAEWIAIAAFGLNVLTLAFFFGAVWRDVQDHGRRLAEVETSNSEVVQKVERIDANVTFLAELAREERGRAN
jgi:hypothetical protein